MDQYKDEGSNGENNTKVSFKSNSPMAVPLVITLPTISSTNEFLVKDSGSTPYVERNNDSETTSYLVQTKVDNQNVPLGVVIDIEIDHNISNDRIEASAPNISSMSAGIQNFNLNSQRQSDRDHSTMGGPPVSDCVARETQYSGSGRKQNGSEGSSYLPSPFLSSNQVIEESESPIHQFQAASGVYKTNDCSDKLHHRHFYFKIIL